jgi:glycosyltransferase involved in cell wall biosynthesis
MPPTEASPRLLFVDNQVTDFLLHRLALARTLRNAGFAVHVAVPREPGLEEIAREGFPPHVIHLRRKSARPADELRCFLSLYRLYRRLRPILVQHIRLKPVLYGGMAARLAGVPAVVNMLTGLGHLFATRNAKTRLLGAAVTRGLRVALSHRNSRVIFQNPEDRDLLLSGGLLDARRAVLIKGSGVDLSQFTPQPEPRGDPVVLMASRLLWEKGAGEFVAAARSLRARGIRARFLLVGEPDPGHPSAIPLSVLEGWHATGDIEWLGWRRDMPALMAQCHIVCMPSAYGEGVPRILIEAAAAGRPLVATDSPGCREIARHGRNALLVPVRDSVGLAGALDELIRKPALRAALGAAGRAIAEREFSQEQVITETLEVYRSLTGMHARSPAQAGCYSISDQVRL